MSCWLDPTMWPACAGVAAANGVAAVASIPGGIAHSFSDAAASAVTWLWQQVSDATTIDLTSAGIRGDLVITAAIAAVIAFALFCIQVAGSALHGSFAGLGRSVRGLLVAFVGATFAIAVTQVTLSAVDALSNGIVQAAVGQNMAQIGAELVETSSLNILGWAGMLLMALVMLVAVAVIWCALMIRKMLIIIAAVFAPIAFSGAAADLTKGWARRWIEFTVALIFSKLILVVIFLIGLSMVNGAGATDSTTNQVTNLAIGILTLLLAGFAPWMAIKMVHFAGDAFHHVHTQAVAAGVGAGAAIAAPQKAASLYSGAKHVIGGSTMPRTASVVGSGRPVSLAGASTPRPISAPGGFSPVVSALGARPPRPNVAAGAAGVALPGGGGKSSGDDEGPGGSHSMPTSVSSVAAEGGAGAAAWAASVRAGDGATASSRLDTSLARSADGGSAPPPAPPFRPVPRTSPPAKPDDRPGDRGPQA